MGLRPLVAVAFVALLQVALGPAQTEARLTCSKEEYVRTGLEFVRCQDDTIKYYNILKKTKDTEENPSACNSLKHIVYNCVEIVRHCFDDRGFERGRRVYLELLALDYPDHQFCQVFDGMKSNDTSKEYNRIPQQLPGELCTIDNEVALLKDLRNCTSSEQTDFMQTLLSQPVRADLGSEETHVDQSVYYFPLVCDGLQVIKDKCYNRLHTCYTGDELDYHMAFLLEDLKITGVTISDRLIPEVAESDLEKESDDKPIVEVAECPMFQNLYTDSSTVTGAVAACVTILLLILLLNLAYFSAVRFRLVPKIRARFVDKTPYEDIVITEQGTNQVTVVPSANSTNSTQQHSSARQDFENSSVTLQAMSEDIGSRHHNQQIRSDLMVNTFGPPESEFRSA